MPQDRLLSRTGLLLAGLAAAAVLVVLIGLLGRPAGTAAHTPSAKDPSPKGYEVRYNATLALARRASPQFRTDLSLQDTLKDMLDEPQQVRNFTRRVKDGQVVADDQEGQPVPDLAAAQATVLGALKATVELHRKDPDLDLGFLASALEELARSSNLVVRTEATRTRLALKEQ